MDKANLQVSQMTDKVNAFLVEKGYSFSLNFDDIKNDLAENQVRERHLAKGLRLLAETQFADENLLLDFYHSILGDHIKLEIVKDEAIIENEIRGALLKAGKPAFVAEDALPAEFA